MIRKYQRKFHIEKNEINKFDLEFKNETEEDIGSALELNETSSSEIFFNIKHIKQAVKNSNESSALGPDSVTAELVENGGEQLFHCLSHIMEASYFLEYLPCFICFILSYLSIYHLFLSVI